MSISISENIKSKYPGGYLLTDNNPTCSLPKAGDVTGESINAEVKKRNSDPRSRYISVVRTSPNVLTQSSDTNNGTAHNSGNGATRDPKCEELLSELKGNEFGDIGSKTIPEVLSIKAKRNAITQEYELRCLSSGERQANQEKRSNARMENKLNQIQRTQQEIQSKQQEIQNRQRGYGY